MKCLIHLLLSIYKCKMYLISVISHFYWHMVNTYPYLVTIYYDIFLLNIKDMSVSPDICRIKEPTEISGNTYKYLIINGLSISHLYLYIIIFLTNM